MIDGHAPILGRDPSDLELLISNWCFAAISCCRVAEWFTFGRMAYKQGAEGEADCNDNLPHRISSVLLIASD
jgi:hypothetical protein